MKKSLIFTAVAIGSMLGASALSALAWTGATTTPPNGNVSAPINVGSLFQEKAGSLQTDGSLGVVGQSLLMGNVGIGTINPFAKLQVVSASTPYNLDSGLIVAQVAATAKRIALGYDTTIDSGYIQSVDSGSGSRPLLLNANNGFVGIGKTNPTATLDVNGTIRFGAAAMSPAAGKVLTSDASGNATWQAFTSGGVGPQGPAGPTGPQGPAGSVRTVTCTAGSYVSSVDASGNAICRTGFSSASNIYQVQSSDVALLGGSWGTINVSCNAGDKVIGGGLKCTQAETLPTISAFPSDSSTLTCMWNGGAGYHCTKCIAICAH